jgi:hypothetical protein
VRLAEQGDASGAAGGREEQTPAEWSADERREFRAAVLALRARQRQAGRLFAAALIALVAAGVVFRAPESWWVPAVGAVALVGVAFRLVNWKCPSCGERLPTRGSKAICLGCGAALD